MDDWWSDRDRKKIKTEYARDLEPDDRDRELEPDCRSADVRVDAIREIWR